MAGYVTAEQIKRAREKRVLEYVLAYVTKTVNSCNYL